MKLFAFINFMCYNEIVINIFGEASTYFFYRARFVYLEEK